MKKTNSRIGNSYAAKRTIISSPNNFKLSKGRKKKLNPRKNYLETK